MPLTITHNKVEIHYWKNIDWVNGGTPNYKQFKSDYTRIVTFPMYGGVSTRCLEHIFEDFNLEEHPFVSYPLPKGCKHTSMSVGDIIKVDETVFIVRSKGFEKICL